MTMQVSLHSFDWTNAHTLGATIAVTGAGFQPKACILWSTIPNASSDAVAGGNIYSAMGVATSPTQRGCIVWTSGDAASSHVGISGGNDDSIVRLTFTNAADFGRLDLQSFDADGATFVVDSALIGGTLANSVIQVMFLGGSDLTNAKMISTSGGGAVGTQDITGFGFDPECCLFLFQQDVLNSSLGSHSTFSFGVCDQDGDEAVLHAYAQGLTNPSNSHSYARRGELIAHTLSNAIDYQAEFSAYISDGVRINWTDTATTVPFLVLGLKGGSYKLASGTTQTDTVTGIPITDVGFRPRGGLVMSACSAENSINTPIDHFQLSLGAFASVTERQAIGQIDVDAVSGSSTVTRSKQFDEVYINLNASDAIEGLMDVQSVNGDGLVFIMDDADPSGVFFWTLLFGDEPSDPPVLVIPNNVGAETTSHFLVGNTAQGQRLWISSDFSSINAVRTVNAVGTLVFEVPGNNYLADDFPIDGFVELWRVPRNGFPTLFLETLWFIRRRVKLVNGGKVTWRITAYDGLYLLGSPSGQRGRIIAYNPSNDFSEKLEETDDMCKEIVRENAGSLASDPARDLGDYLNIAADLSQGPLLHKEFSRRNVLATLQEIAQASDTMGTYLAFDIVCTAPPSSIGLVAPLFSLEFRTYTGQRGADHRASTDNPVLIGPDFGNMDDVEVDEDWTEEANYIYCTGQSVEHVTAVAVAQDDGRIGVGPYGRREYLVNGSDSIDLETLEAEADAALRAEQPKRSMTGTLLDSDQARFDVDWTWGDFLTAQEGGASFDCRVETISLEVKQDTGEVIKGTVRGEDAES